MAQATKSDYTLWLTSPFTKALLCQLDIDEADLCQNWSQGRYEFESQLRAQGQTQYIDALRHAIKDMWRGGEDE